MHSMSCRDGLLPRSVVRCSILFLALLGITACQRENATETPPAESASIYSAASDAEGVAEIRDRAGELVMAAAVLDPSGEPLPDIVVTYFDSAPEALVAFNDVSGNEPYGLFAVTRSTRARAASPGMAVTRSPESASFILDLVDITSGRLYDPARDGFAAPLPNTLRSLRKVLAYEDLATLLTLTPGLREVGTKTGAEVLEMIGPSLAHFLATVDRADEEYTMIAHRMLRLGTWLNGRSPNYRLQIWWADGDVDGFHAVPLGVQVKVTIDTPVNGQTIAGNQAGEITLSGRIDEPPVFLTTDGGHVELYGNGSLVAGALSVGGDGSGGTTFSTPIRLAPGENRLEVVAYAGESGWGFATPASGEVGRAVATVTYQGQENRSPTLIGFQNAATAPAPDGVVDFLFTFADPDGDIVGFHQKLSGFAQGQPFSVEADGSVSEHPELVAMVGGLSGSANAPLAYQGLEAGDWATQEFWVVDGEGNASNHLTGTVQIVAGLRAETGQPAGVASFAAFPSARTAP